MKVKLIAVLIAALFLSVAPISASSNAVPSDKTLRFSGPFNMINPCNSELISGTIDINIVVTTTRTGNGNVKVNVHHTSHGLMTGVVSGDEYRVSRHAKGQFDAISNQYIVNWTGEFIGKGAAPNFSADATLRVFVNADNEPIGSQGLLPVSTTCND